MNMYVDTILPFFDHPDHGHKIEIETFWTTYNLFLSTQSLNFPLPTLNCRRLLWMAPLVCIHRRWSVHKFCNTSEFPLGTRATAENFRLNKSPKTCSAPVNLLHYLFNAYLFKFRSTGTIFFAQVETIKMLVRETLVAHLVQFDPWS